MEKRKPKKPKMFNVPLVDSVRIEPYPHVLYHVVQTQKGQSYDYDIINMVAEITNYTVSMTLKRDPGTEAERSAIEDKIRAAIMVAQEAEPFKRLDRYVYSKIPEQSYYDNNPHVYSYGCSAKKKLEMETERQKTINRVRVDWNESPPKVIIDHILSFTMLKKLFRTGLMADNLQIAEAYEAAARQEKRGAPYIQRDTSRAWGESRTTKDVSLIDLNRLEPAVDGTGAALLGDLSAIPSLDEGAKQLRHALATGRMSPTDVGRAIYVLAGTIQQLPAPVSATASDARDLAVIPPESTIQDRAQYLLSAIAGGRTLVPEREEQQRFIPSGEEVATLSQVAAEQTAKLQRRFEETGMPMGVIDERAWMISRARSSIYPYIDPGFSDDTLIEIYHDDVAMDARLKAAGGNEEAWRQEHDAFKKRWNLKDKPLFDYGGGSILSMLRAHSAHRLMEEANGSYRRARIFAGACLLDSDGYFGLSSMFAPDFKYLEHDCLVAYYMHERIKAYREANNWDEFDDKAFKLKAAFFRKFTPIPPGKDAFDQTKQEYARRLAEAHRERVRVPEDIQALADQFYIEALEDVRKNESRELVSAKPGMDMAELAERDAAYLGGVKHKVCVGGRERKYGYGPRNNLTYITVNPGLSQPRPIPKALQRVLDAHRAAESEGCEPIAASRRIG